MAGLSRALGFFLTAVVSLQEEKEHFVAEFGLSSDNVILESGNPSISVDSTSKSAKGYQIILANEFTA